MLSGKRSLLSTWRCMYVRCVCSVCPGLWRHWWRVSEPRRQQRDGQEVAVGARLQSGHFRIQGDRLRSWQVCGLGANCIQIVCIFITARMRAGVLAEFRHHRCRGGVSWRVPPPKKNCLNIYKICNMHVNSRRGVSLARFKGNFQGFHHSCPTRFKFTGFA